MNKESWLTGGIGLALTLIVVSPILAGLALIVFNNWEAVVTVFATAVFLVSSFGLFCDYMKER